jgi:hypothetical protein
MGRRSVIGSYDHRLIEASIEVKAREFMKDNHCPSTHFSALHYVN